METPGQQTPLPLDYETPDPTAGRPRVFWPIYLLTFFIGLEPIERYVFGGHFCGLEGPFYALALAPIAFAVQWPYRRWIQPLPLPAQVPLIIGAALLSAFPARLLVLLQFYCIQRVGLLR